MSRDVSDMWLVAKASDGEPAGVVCKSSSRRLKTYHAAGELLQGGAAALFSVCWMLFLGKGGGCLDQVRVLRGGRGMS